MRERDGDDGADEWARLRFAIIGPLLAAPPARGALHAALETLAHQPWGHPITGTPVHFGVSTLERWYYAARQARRDALGALRPHPRKDRGGQPSLRDALRTALRAQYAAHRSWSTQLHADNLRVLVAADAALGPMPSYATVRRYLRAQGLVRERRVRPHGPPAAGAVLAGREPREVRSFEVEYVHGLWHLDFHHGSHPVLTRAGTWVRPKLLGVLDDRSRLACHVQWYLDETAETLVHGLCQAIQKRALPRALLTDNGSAMLAAETVAGLEAFGILHATTLPYSPYQKGYASYYTSSVASAASWRRRFFAEMPFHVFRTGASPPGGS